MSTLVSAPDTVSVSQLTLYLTCSLKYRFQYIDRLPRLIRSAPLALGSSMHAALEWLHKERKAGRQPTLDQLLRVFDADWHAQLLEQDEAALEEPVDLITMKGKELLALYFHLPAKPVVDAELFFQIPLVNPATGEVLPIPLRGVIDLIEADDTLVELKTSQRRWNVESLPDNLQLTTYSYAYRMLFGRPAREIRLVNLVRTKTPVIEAHPTERNDRDHERLFHVSREVLKGVTAGVFLPNRGCWLCRDCEYDADCREWAGNEEGA